MKEDISDILHIAVNAPSGNNSQPWRFVVDAGKISIWNLPNSDKFLFNYQKRGSFIAHGALIENILIAASEKGFKASVKLFPDDNKTDLVAEINLEKSEDKYKYGYLYPFILKRTTNRKPYRKTSFRDEDERTIDLFCQSIKNSGVEILLKQDIQIISELSKSLSAADRLIFENFDIHEAFFAKVSWTREEEQKKREGLYVGTKELSPVVRFLFKYAFSNWNALKILNKFNLSMKAAKKREKLYNHCSAIGLIVAKNDHPEDFIETGRILERLWLITTSLGVSFQPVSAGLLYIGQRMQRETPEEFTKDQVEFIKIAYQNILKVFNSPNMIPTFSFRLGYADPPTASSIKKSPQIEWL